MSAKEMFRILDSITWYNGISFPLLKIKEKLINKKDKSNFLRPEEDCFKDSQFEIFWMILVLLYGDYGTSPRYGWLEMKNKDNIIWFINEITKTEREDLSNV